MIRLRKPRTDDRWILALVKKELFPYALRTHPHIRWDDQEVRKRLQMGTTFVACGRQRSEMAGFITVMPNGKELFLDMIAVEPNQQGRGWGSLLIRKAEMYAKDKGCDTIRLFVDEENANARRFYDKHGFAVIQYYPHMRCFELKKSIAR